MQQTALHQHRPMRNHTSRIGTLISRSMIPIEELSSAFLVYTVFRSTQYIYLRRQFGNRILYHRRIHERIIRPDDLNILSRRQRNPFIHGVVETVIRLTDEAGDMRLIFFYDLPRRIRRATINDDVFDMRIGLPDDACYRLLQCIGPIAGDRDNADRRSVLPCHLSASSRMISSIFSS